MEQEKLNKRSKANPIDLIADGNEQSLDEHRDSATKVDVAAAPKASVSGKSRSRIRTVAATISDGNYGVRKGRAMQDASHNEENEDADDRMSDSANGRDTASADSAIEEGGGINRGDSNRNPRQPPRSKGNRNGHTTDTPQRNDMDTEQTTDIAAGEGGSDRNDDNGRNTGITMERGQDTPIPPTDAAPVTPGDDNDGGGDIAKYRQNANGQQPRDKVVKDNDDAHAGDSDSLQPGETNQKV